MPKTYEIVLKQIKIIVVTETIFKQVYPMHLREEMCPYCRKRIQYAFYGTEEAFREIVEKK